MSEEPPWSAFPGKRRIDVARSLLLIFGGLIAAVLVWLWSHPVRVICTGEWVGMQFDLDCRNGTLTTSVRSETLGHSLSHRELSCAGFRMTWGRPLRSSSLNPVAAELTFRGPVPLFLSVVVVVTIVAGWTLTRIELWA